MTRAALLAALVAFPSLAFAGEGEPLLGSYTTNCPSPHQCGLHIIERPTEHGLQLFAAFTVETRDDEAAPMCKGSGGVVFPMMRIHDFLASTNKEFGVVIRTAAHGLTVENLPDSLCGVRLNGAYSEIGD